jgi:MFS family permease
LITFAICIFLSAFLLFQIQPMVSKFLLPWFGGAPAVWSSAMLFFQIALTGGYAYSNWLIGKNNVKKQTLIHILLLCSSVCLVVCLWIFWPSPVTPSAYWKPENIAYPALYLFLLLIITIGLPFFVLSTNSPLMQAWFTRKDPARSPYSLYALSNIGSILGLLTYPILIEPMLSLRWQGWVWAGCYMVFVILAGYNAILISRRIPPLVADEKNHIVDDKQSTKAGTQSLWILLSACSSLMVLAVTNQITQEVAAIPFLWVLPLTIYLLSFVLAFSGKHFYHRKLFTVLLLLGTVAWFFVTISSDPNFIMELITYNFLLFAVTMVCHGELYDLRPPVSRLTRFYLMVSAGGALGGIIVNLVAPVLFKGYWELYFGVAFVWVLLSVLMYRQPDRQQVGLLVAAVAVLVTIHLGSLIYYSLTENLFIQRNFFGVVHVRQRTLEPVQQKVNVLVHGTTIHGYQFLDSDLRDSPTSYYSRDSGIGLLLLNHPRYGSSLRVGVLGLGIGTLAAYGQPEDYYRFYEINPAVIDLANGQGGYFSFIEDSQSSIDIIPGDARLSLEQEVNVKHGNDFDILVLDVFNSDSIPVHLVTSEAFEIYLQNLAPDGLIAAHSSNERLDMRPVFWQLAQYYDLDFAILENPAENDNPAALRSTWIVLTRDSKILELPALTDKITRGTDFPTDIRLWTDDYSNLIQLLK